MRKGKTLEEVKNEIDILSNGAVEMISNEYIDRDTILTLKCSCGNIYKQSFKNFKRGTTKCPICIQNQNKISPLTINDIKDKIDLMDCEYISGEYVNENSLITVKCKCGNIFKKEWKYLRKGSIRCSECTQKKISESLKIYTDEMADEVFQSFGYTRIGDFCGAQKKTKCICKNNHECYINLSLLKLKNSGCFECMRENAKGKNSHRYKGGVTQIEDALRNNIKRWKKSIKELYKQCPISGKTTALVVHHLTSFNLLYEKAINSLGIDIKKYDTVNIFCSSDDFDVLLNEIISYHTLDSGILLSKDIHIKFHKEYGYGNNTPQQFDEFLNKYYSISLKDILLP